MEASTCHYAKAAASWGSRPGLPRRARTAQMVVFSDFPQDACGPAARPLRPSPKGCAVNQCSPMRQSELQPHPLEMNAPQSGASAPMVSVPKRTIAPETAAPPPAQPNSQQADNQSSNTDCKADWGDDLINC